MRKLLDLKAGAIFHEEMDRITLCVRKEPKGQRQSENRFLSYRKRFLSMRKLLDLKAGAIFHEEMDRITLCVRKECIEIIYP